MNVKLLFHSPLWLASHAIRMSHDNHDKSDTTAVQMNSTDYCIDDCYMERNGEAGAKDKELIARVGNKLKHKSVLEQLVYWFDIDGISRGCLQELARHRTARLTVKSSRYTLKELKDSDEDSLGLFLVDSDNFSVNYYNLKQLRALREELITTNLSNDIAKYMLPEAFKTRLQWQIDMRNYQSFLELRLDKSALWEIRELAYATYKALPPEHRYLVNDIIIDKGYEVC